MAVFTIDSAARIPSTRPEQDYLAYLDSLYTPLEGLHCFRVAS